LLEIIKNQVGIKGVIGLSDRTPGDAISGFVYMGKYCEENNLNFIPVDSYNLMDKKDIEKLSGLDLDILIVGPWGRLIPDWLIEQCKVGAIGMHGSSYGITGGRGRSPENWSLILNEEEFSISIFKIDIGIDSGEIIDTRVFNFSALDDIASARYKMIWNVGQMIIKLLAHKELSTLKGIPQTGFPRYLPQRIPSDGEIDWHRSAKELHNFVRALTKPYPGAFSGLKDGGTILIWRASPLSDLPELEKYQCGEIITYSGLNKQLLVKTGRDALFITEYEFRPESSKSLVKEGDILNSVDFYDQSNEIFQRHYNKYPEKIIQEKIVGFAESYRNRKKASISINE
jgi:methionyl-tRNA formyltransferase